MSKPQLLWQITYSDTPFVSYVFGTMHVKDIKAFRYQDLVCAKIDESTAFATEIDLNRANVALNAQSMDLQEGQTLADFYTPKQYAKIAKFFTAVTGLPFDHFNTSQPMMLINLLTASMLNNDMAYALDEFLWRYAASKGKLLLGIETVQEQIDVMHRIPLDFQLKALYKMAKNKTRFRKQLLGMTDIYESGDLKKILKSAKKSTGKLRKLLLYSRNTIMADRIERLSREQSIVAAIGAGHLGGKKGVLKLLKDKGMTVKMVRLAGR